MWSRRAGCGDCAGRATEASSPLHALSRDDTILRGRGETAELAQFRRAETFPPKMDVFFLSKTVSSFFLQN